MAKAYWVREEQLVDEQASMDISSQPGTVRVIKVETLPPDEHARCRACGDANTALRFIPIYVIGSEGVHLCHTCEMAVVEFVSSIIRVGAIGRKVGFKACKDLRDKKEAK